MNPKLFSFRRVLTITVMMLLFSAPILLAGTTGKIAGTVKAAVDGEALPGANIILRARIINSKEVPLNPAAGAAADLDGNFFVINVQPGQYIVECAMMGYQRQVKKPVRVEVDRTTTVNFSLTEETLQGEAVVVVAESPLVVRDLTSVSAKVGGDDLKKLPVESFQDVLKLQSGITTSRDGAIHIRGGRTSEIKYYVDGIAISNPFNNNLAVPVENNAIQEMEVISGTFNAEYGQAQSGIVNIVTKEGAEKYAGTLSAYLGDYLSNHTEIFGNIDDFNPMAQQYFEGDFSGPLLSPRLKFFVSGRYTNQDNWLFGQRVYLPIDSSNFTSTNPDEWYIEKTGDSAWVSMNSSQNLTGQFKLTFQPLPAVKLSYNLISNYQEAKPYGGKNYKYNPDSRRTNYITANNHLFNLTHTLTPRIFYSLKLIYYVNDFKTYVYEDPYDPGYIATFGRDRQPSNIFSTGGVDPYHEYKKSQTYAARADFNWQINNANFVKIGAEYRTHKLNFENFNIKVDPYVYGSWERHLQPVTSTEHNLYEHKPFEFAAYIQDKIEIKDLIVNMGLRFDYFDPKSVVPTDFRDPANKLYVDPASEAYREVDPKTQISPRLGLAFPITVDGVIHAAYGQFFQIPEMDRLYENPEFEVAGYANSFIGNADLDAQRTDMYELGLQKQLVDFLAVDITGFYRNVRNLMGSELMQTYRTDILYGRYANNSHGSVRGVTLAAKIRVPNSGVVADLNYTYQTAKGIASDPKQSFYDAAGRNEGTIVLNPLDWDLRHTFNMFINYTTSNWGGSIITRINSGYPFTPGRYQESYIELRNQGRYKGDLAVDLGAYRQFKVGGFQLELFTKVINLFDQTRADQLPQVRPLDEEAHAANEFDRFNTLYEYSIDPTLQPVPREIRVGTKIIF